MSGLLLQVTPNGGRSWILRTKVGDKRREIGLGGFPTVTLAQAREKARDVREKIEQGTDPVAERKAAKRALATAQRRNLTFADAVDRYLAAKLDGFSNAKHRKQWGSTLATYATPELGGMDVDTITVQDILRVLEPIWRTKTETASRVRGRIEAVLSWATVSGHRTGENPARWKSNLKELLPAPSQLKNETHHPAVCADDVARWFEALRNRDGMGARALEFLTYTAARSGEVRGAAWDEIDLKTRTWTVHASRMKNKRDHRVPLTDDAVALLEALPRFAEQPLVFPSPRGKTLSDMTLSATMRRMHDADPSGGFFDTVSKRPAVPHGLRSTFRDWVSEKTNYPGDMAEVALAHKISSAVEAAYRRGDMIEKRRRMMEAWACVLKGVENKSQLIELNYA